MNAALVETRPKTDPWGLLGLPETAATLSYRARRGMRHGLTLRQPTPNGIHDPMSHMLIVETLLNVKPYEQFPTRALVGLLRLQFPWMAWDLVTVGRILGDLEEALVDVAPGPIQPLHRKRLRDGTYWTMNQTEAGWLVLVGLRRELQKLAELEIEQLQRGQKPDRLSSPLEECRSLRPAWANEPLLV